MAEELSSSSLEEGYEQVNDLVSVSQVSAFPDPSSLLDGKSARDYEGDGGESTAYNRKEKSLGELCRRFLFFYGTPQRGLLYLDQCTKELGVERRRIYDIINILESFSVIQRCAKNEYQWRGIDKIVLSIEKQINACVSGPRIILPRPLAAKSRIRENANISPPHQGSASVIAFAFTSVLGLLHLQSRMSWPPGSRADLKTVSWEFCGFQDSWPSAFSNIAKIRRLICSDQVAPLPRLMPLRQPC